MKKNMKLSIEQLEARDTPGGGTGVNVVLVAQWNQSTHGVVFVPETSITPPPYIPLPVAQPGQPLPQFPLTTSVQTFAPFNQDQTIKNNAINGLWLETHQAETDAFFASHPDFNRDPNYDLFLSNSGALVALILSEEHS